MTFDSKSLLKDLKEKGASRSVEKHFPKNFKFFEVEKNQRIIKAYNEVSKNKNKNNNECYRKKKKSFNNSVIIDSRTSKFRNYQILSNKNNNNNNWIRYGHLSKYNSLFKKCDKSVLNNKNHNNKNNNYFRSTTRTSSIKSKNINWLNLEIQSAINKTGYLCSASNISYKINRNVNLNNKSLNQHASKKNYKKDQCNIGSGNHFDEIKNSNNKYKKKRNSMDHISENSSFSTFCNSVIIVKK